MLEKNNENGINGFDTIPALHHGMRFLAQKALIPCVEQNCLLQVVTDGVVLPHAAIDQIRGFSLRRSYSAKQVRTINRLRMRKIKYGRGTQKSSNPRSVRYVPSCKQLIVKQAFGGSVKL